MVHTNSQYCFKTLDNKKVYKASREQSEEWDLRIFKRYRIQYSSVQLYSDTLRLEGVEKIERGLGRVCSTSSQIVAEAEAQKGEGITLE